MAGRDLIGVGTSAGGVEALKTLVGGLPKDFPAAVCVALHLPPEAPSMLPAILSRAGPLPAAHARDGESLQPGRIYVAPPDHHLVVHGDRLRLERGPRENRHRPAIDPLFRSAARSRGPRAVGVILTGSLDDGTAGLLMIKRRGGVAVVQDPEDALFAGMPRSALANVRVDYKLPVREIPSLLDTLVRERVPEAAGAGLGKTPDLDVEADPEKVQHMEKLGQPSAYACPECSGVLWEVDDKDLLRFRCRVGHAFSSDTLLSQQDDYFEDALWAAVRSLEENASLSARVAERLRAQNNESLARSMEQRARITEKHAGQLRRVLEETEKMATKA
jgi:two-component system chemotaxis response regulator CheB